MGLDVTIDASKVFDHFKKLTPALFSIMLLTGLILFLPQSILDKMALADLPIVVRMIFGIFFLLSSALVITIIIFSFSKRVISQQKRKQFINNRKKQLQHLSGYQKKILYDLLESNEKKIYLDPNSGDTLYLLNNGFIYQPAQIISVDYDNNTIMAYTPQPWLLDLYNDNPNLFQ